MTVDTDPPDDLKSSHTTAADGNVFADLGFTPKEAKALLADADARIATARTTEEPADQFSDLRPRRPD